VGRNEPPHRQAIPGGGQVGRHFRENRGCQGYFVRALSGTLYCFLMQGLSPKLLYTQWRTQKKQLFPFFLFPLPFVLPTLTFFYFLHFVFFYFYIQEPYTQLPFVEPFVANITAQLKILYTETVEKKFAKEAKGKIDYVATLTQVASQNVENQQFDQAYGKIEEARDLLSFLKQVEINQYSKQKTR
jgi:hypothetical protein